MEAAIQRRVQRYGWDRAAALYERHWSDQLRPAQDATLRLAALRPGDRVLDVACGTGLVTLRAARAVAPSGRTVGTDLSDRMIASARSIAAAEQLPARFERMDAEALSLEADSFDAVLCALGLMYVPSPVTALGEMHRVAAPGGRVVVAVWGARDRCGWAEVFPIVDARVRTDVCPLFFRLGTGDTLARTLAGAGLTDITTERISTPLHYDSAAEACGAAFAGGPVALAYSRFDAAVRDAVHREYLASIEPFRRDDGYDVPGEFMIARGWKR